MKRFTFVFMACAACGGAAVAGGGTTPIVVPQQPPQPTAPAVASPADADAAAPVAAARPFECKTGQRFETTTRAYCAYADALSWDAAERRCVENGGHLATVDSANASQVMKSILGSPAAVPRALWIGLELKKAGGKKEWRWSNGAMISAPSWSTGEPNDFYDDGSEACGEWLVTDGRWNDTRCNVHVPFLCQMAKKPLPCTETTFSSLFDGKYCVSKKADTFEGAKQACARQGGTLAGPISEAENDLLRKTLAARFAPRRFWIGLSDVSEEGRWSWSSGASFDHAEWEAGEPNDYQKEDCVEVYADDWAWNDFDCSAPKASVCESAPKKK